MALVRNKSPTDPVPFTGPHLTAEMRRIRLWLLGIICTLVAQTVALIWWLS